jgi:hypothetical protein
MPESSHPSAPSEPQQSENRVGANLIFIFAGGKGYVRLSSATSGTLYSFF